MALLNKNNQRVKLADGLTEIGMSQVKSEIGGSSSNIPSFDKKILSEDAITLEGSGYETHLIVPEFVAFMQETFGGEAEWWRHMVDETVYGFPLTFPKDYRFTLIYNDGSSTTFSCADAKDIGQYPNDSVEFGMSSEWNYGYSNDVELEVTSENSADIKFYMPNGSVFTLSVSIELDPETGDVIIVFGTVVQYNEGTSSIPVTDLDKLIVWMPSCNTHFVEKHVVNDFDGLASFLPSLAGIDHSVDRIFYFEDAKIEDLTSTILNNMEFEFLNKLFPVVGSGDTQEAFIYFNLQGNIGITESEMESISKVSCFADIDPETGEGAVAMKINDMTVGDVPVCGYFSGSVRIKVVI